MERTQLLALTLALSLSQTGWGADSNSGPAPTSGTSFQEASAMKISLEIGGKAMTASLIDTETTRDFVSLLPLTLR